MGGNKHRQLLSGEPLLVHSLRYLRAQCESVTVASADSWVDQWLLPGERRVLDELPECGPLGGILAGLTQSEHRWNLLAPVDQPYLPVLLGSWLQQQVGQARGVVPCPECDPNPLAALLHRDLGVNLRLYLATGQRRVLGWLRQLGPAITWVEHLPVVSPQSYLNLNHPDQLC